MWLRPGDFYPPAYGNAANQWILYQESVIMISQVNYGSPAYGFSVGNGTIGGWYPGLSVLDGTSGFQSNGDWVHCVYTVDASGQQLFANGLLVQSNTNAVHQIGPNGYSLGLGAYYNGAIDELRIYNRALSSNEVAELYALEAPVPPVITNSPQSVAAVAGSSTNLNVTATGSGALRYQWLKDGVALPGATNATFVFSNLQPVNVGDYAAVVSNGGGSVTSSVASVSIPGVNSGVWQGLVAYYPFNGNANDESGYGNNGTVYGATLATDRFGSLSSCYSFIGNNNGPNNGYISVPSSSALQLTTNLTLSLWMKKTTNLLWGIVLCKGDNPEKSYSLTYDTRGTGGIDFNQQGSYNMINAYQALPNDWIQVVCTLFGTNACVYYNGAFLTNGIGVSLGKGNGALTFGTILSAAPMSYSGLLDDIRIYERALSSNEVAQLYLSEAPPTPPRTGTATATLSFGFFVNATVTDSGFGYTNTPLVRIVGGGGSGAQAVAVVSNGLVVGINVINPGSGYTSAPMVVIQPPVIAQPELGISAHTLLSFTNLAVSGNYQLQRSKEWYWTNEAASFTATGLFYTQMVAGAPGSKTYRLALSPAPAQAFATPVVAYGFLVAANVTAGGSGYVSKPNVHIAGGGGSNAVAVANMSGGSVSSISMLNAGYGYTNTPTLQIDPPPAASINPSAIPVMRVDSGALSPYDKYQVEFKPELGGAWQNWGGNFVPTAATNSQWLYITNGMGFFRVKYLP